MDPFPSEQAGRYRPRLPEQAPRQIPDRLFDELFAALGCHRDRALVALWISTGARAAELLSAWCAGVCAGDQTITVVRKGTRALQALPASPDAFVWLRLYQQQMRGLVPAGGPEGRDRRGAGPSPETGRHVAAGTPAAGRLPAREPG
jgi:site-specific recombinase XerD